MSRYFMVQSWVGSHENEPDYSGQQCGARDVRSIEAVPLYDQFGNANTSAFSDEAIASRKKVKPKLPIQARILPQNVTLSRLDLQEAELESALDDGTCSIEEYIECKRVIAKKRNRAIKALNKLLEIEEEPTYTNVLPEQENASSSVFDLFKAGMQAIPEAVCKGNAKEMENSFWFEAKYFLCASLAGAMLLLTLANI